MSISKRKSQIQLTELKTSKIIKIENIEKENNK